MGRISLKKQIEAAAADRMVAVSQGDGTLEFEAHIDALIDDLDFMAWPVVAHPLVPAADMLLYRRGADGIIYHVPIQNIATGGGGGGAISTYTITPPGGSDIDGLTVVATAPVTISRIDADTVRVTVPDGHEIYGGAVHFPTAGNPGTDFHFQILWEGNDTDGFARKRNIDSDTLWPCDGYVINKSAIGAGGPTRALPLAMSRVSGSALLIRDVTGVKGVTAPDPGGTAFVEVRFREYDSVSNGGNSDTIFVFTL